MIDKNDSMYAHYPHINKKKNTDGQSENSTIKDNIDNFGGGEDNNNGQNKKTLKKKWPIFIILLLIAGIAAFACFKMFHHPDTGETEYINVGEERIRPSVTLDPESDLDEDGFTNGEEEKLGTNPRSMDTDLDGLIDYDEVNETKTDPLKADTDKDGVDDGTEIALGLDPLNTKTDGTPDGERTFEISHKLDEGSLTVTGKACVANIYAEKVEFFNKANNPGIVSDMYEFYIEGNKFDTAELRLTYEDNVLKNSGYTEDDLAIFQYMNDGTYKKVGGEVDTENNTVTVTLEHFSKYCLAVTSVVEQKAASKVFIVLDNSGSMYPDELCEGSEENDVDFKRVDFAKNLIEANLEEVQFGLAKFTGTYTELCGGFDNKKEDMFTKLDSIKTIEETFDGTHIAEAIISACENFSKEDITHRKFIVLLTDGETTEGKGLLGGIFDFNENDAIKVAREKNVAIIVVGLGNSVDSYYCKKIASSTNGKFIYANNSTALDDVYEAINAVMNNGFVDSDEDGKMDQILIADSGFDITKNAFSFDNYAIKTVFSDNAINGQCHGMAVFAQRYYLGTLPQSANQIFEYKLSLFGDRVDGGMPYNLMHTDFFGNGDNKYTKSQVNLKEYILFEKLYNVETNNIWDKYQRSKEDKYYLEYKPEIKEFIKNNPLLVLHEKQGENTIKTGKNAADGKEYKYKYFDSYSFTIDTGLNNKWDEETKDAYSILCALNNLWAGQGKDKWYDTYRFSDKGFKKIVDLVNSGIIPVAEGERHATNLTHIYRDIDNPLKYTLMLYDNNDPNNYKVLTLTKTKYNKFQLNYTAWVNDYKFEIFDTDDVYFKKGKAITIDFKVFTK